MIAALMGVPGKLKAIKDLITTGLDAAVTTRAAASTALSNAVWTNALATELDGLAPAIAAIPTTLINSIQHTTVSITGTATSATKTITSVTKAKSVLILLGWNDNQTNVLPPYIELTNATTVTASRSTPGVSTITSISFIVLEFK
jgi:hypothetical protein